MSAWRGAQGLYLAALLWCFLGVAIVADIFMAAIECITSQEKKVYLAVSGKQAPLRLPLLLLLPRAGGTLLKRVVHARHRRRTSSRHGTRRWPT